MDDNDYIKNSKAINYSLKIKSSLGKRIDSHVRALKYLEGSAYSKKRWIQDAITEKLKSWKTSDLEEIQPDCTLNFGISPIINEEITQIIMFLKKLKIKTSKTDFFLEAIYEKLSKEEKTTKELFKRILESKTGVFN
jgi:hypothetical protein